MPRPGPGPRRPRSEEEEAGEPVAGVAAGTEKQYADAVQYCTGEGPLRTGPTVRTETNGKERPVSRSTLVGLVSVCYCVTKWLLANFRLYYCRLSDLMPLLGVGLVAVKALGGGANLVGPGAAAVLEWSKSSKFRTWMAFCKGTSHFLSKTLCFLSRQFCFNSILFCMFFQKSISIT